jgi:hypothetical protein
MNTVEGIGYLAASLVLGTFCMKSWMRSVSRRSPATWRSSPMAISDTWRNPGNIRDAFCNDESNYQQKLPDAGLPADHRAFGRLLCFWFNPCRQH